MGVTKNSIEWIVYINNRMTAIAIWLVSIMVGILMCATSNSSTKDLPKLLRTGQWALYSTSILLAVGVFEMFSLFSWGGNLLSSTMKTEKLIESVESIVHSLTLGFGIFFSAILAILFIPLLLLQRSKIRELVHGDEKWRSKWLTTQGLPSSLMTMAGEVVALIIPFVTSLISNLGN